MIWLTWRQHRTEAFVVAGVLVALAALILITGHNMADSYQQLGVADCVAHPNHPNCDTIVNTFFSQYGALESAMPWLNFLPALLAMLVGAPLVARELEHGTHRLVWTQSVTRERWLAVKLAFILGAALLVFVILTLLLTWWRGPFDALNGRFQPGGFDFEGVVSLAYVAFALSVAIAAGALIRKAIPAMAVTLAAFLALRLPVELWLRPRYQSPINIMGAIGQSSSSVPNAAWIVADGWADHLGHRLSDAQVFNTCSPRLLDKPAFVSCIQSHGILEYISYQPADRFWAFQGIETAIFASVAVAFLALTIWWVARRIS